MPHSTPELERVGRRERMYRLENGRWRPDDFSHEQSLVLDTAKGLVIFNSCSHGGAANIINEVAAAFPDKTVYALIGGFHLYNKPASEVRALAEKLRQTGVAYMSAPATAPAREPTACCGRSWATGSTSCRWARSWSFKNGKRRKEKC